MSINLSNSWWYRYIAFEALRVGSARIVKNTIYGLAAGGDTGFVIWFPASNEKVGISYDDVQALLTNSRPFNGKINKQPVKAGSRDPSTLLRESSSGINNEARTPRANVNPEDLFVRPSAIKVKDESPTYENGTTTSEERENDQTASIIESINTKMDNATVFPNTGVAHLYGCQMRPPSIGAIPRDYQPILTLTKEETAIIRPNADPVLYRHGCVGYANPLPAGMEGAFELKYLGEIKLGSVSRPETNNASDGSAPTASLEVARLTKYLATGIQLRIIVQRIKSNIDYDATSSLLTEGDVALHVSSFKKTPKVYHNMMRNHPDYGTPSFEENFNLIRAESLRNELVSLIGVDVRTTFRDMADRTLFHIMKDYDVPYVSQPIEWHRRTRDQILALTYGLHKYMIEREQASQAIAACAVLCFPIYARGTKPEIDAAAQLYLMLQAASQFGTPEFYDKLRICVKACRDLGFSSLLKDYPLPEALAGKLDGKTLPADDANNFALVNAVIKLINANPQRFGDLDVEFVRVILNKVEHFGSSYTELDKYIPQLSKFKSAEALAYESFMDVFRSETISDDFIKARIEESQLQDPTGTNDPIVIDDSAFEDKPQYEYQIVRDGMIPNNPQWNPNKSEFPLELRPLEKVYKSGGAGDIVPCTDQEIIDMINEVSEHLGNRMKLNLPYLRWGIGKFTAIISLRRGAGQVLSICPSELKQHYGRVDATILGSAITHEMAHYTFDNVVRESDRRKFRRATSGIRIHSSQMSSSGSPYPFYHEQFAMLAEFGVWGSCARGLQTTKGFDICNKYFECDTRINDEILENYP